MKTRDTEYLYATTRIRTLEKGLLDQSAMERLLDCSGVEDMAKVLSELGYPDLQIASVRDIENSLYRTRRDTFDLLENISPKKEIAEIFRLRYDYHNVKVILKGEASGEKVDGLLFDAGRYAPEFLVTLVRQMEYKELPEILQRAIEEAREVLARTGDAQLCDFILDTAYFNEMSLLASKSESKFLCDYVKCLIDTANLRATLRSMRQHKDVEFLSHALQKGGNIPEDKFITVLSGECTLVDLCSGTILESAAAVANISGSMVAFERECDDAIMTYLRKARYVAFGEEPLVAYIAAREADIMAIRIILAGKLQELPTDEIRERLRACYV